MKAKTTFSFGWSTGAPFKEEDAKIAGTALKAMAEARNVEDVRSLDAREVFAEVYADKAHPMRALYGNFEDVEGAARKHWVDQTRRIIRSIQIVQVNVSGREKREPMFVTCQAPLAQKPDGWKSGRARVLTEDVLRHDPQYASALGEKIRAVQNAVKGFDWLVNAGRPTKEVAQLKDSLNRALDDYMASVQGASSAAE